MSDSDWALDLQDRRVRPSNHWSRASLCIDLAKFEAEVESKVGKVRKIEAGKILDWIVLDKVIGQSPDQRPVNYIFPLLNAWEHHGRFIRLSRVWDLAQRDLSEDEYEELLKPMFQLHKVAEHTQTKLLRPFAQFMKVIENIKNNSFVHALQIESFQLTPQWTKDDYSDAIVNIFTRLNTAGRILTREEITLAWLKVGWERDKTNGKNAGACLTDLHDALAERGFKLETDEIVRLISFVWAVENRQGTLLDSKDLLKGDIVRSLATSTARQWNRLMPDILKAADLIKSRELPDKSFNAMIVVLTWHRLVFNKFDMLTGLLCIQRDDLEKHLQRRSAQFVDRWTFASEWAGVWGDASVLNFQNFASDLTAIHTALQDCQAHNFIAVVDQSVAKLMDRVVFKAIQHIENLVVKDKRRVHYYHNLLWIWHRLDEKRWNCSSLPLRTGRKRTSKWEVDHSISDAWWQRAVKKEVEEKLKTYIGTDLDKLTLGPDGFDSLLDACAFINLIGNCSLLEKSFNISKSDKPMWTFLQEVHEFKQGVFERQNWQSALLLNDTMTTPDGKTLKELRTVIQTRDASIRNELKEFVNGSKPRADL